MKSNKILKITLITLVIILLSIISFIGIYVQDKNKIANIVKDYKLGMDLEGSRKIELEVNKSTKKINYDKEGKEIQSTDTQTEVAKTEEKVINEEENLTVENYKKTKKILEDRLKTMGVNDYQIRLNETTGNIILNIPEDDNTDLIVAQTGNQGKFEIIDNDTNEVLMTNEHLKSVKAGYGTTAAGTTTIFVNIEFNKEGTQKFKDITNIYKEMKTTNEETGEETTTKKEIAIKVDDSTLLKTHFSEEINNGILQLSVGSSASTTTPEELQNSLTNANNLAALLNNGKMPIVYNIAQNKYIESEITNYNIKLFTSLYIVLITIGMIYLIIKYKEKGIVSSISIIGYMATLLIVLRYTNVIITLDGIIAIILSVILTYISIIEILKQNEKINNIEESFKKAMKKYVLTFNKWLPIFSFGMVIFWGIVVNLLYNLVVTKILLAETEN